MEMLTLMVGNVKGRIIEESRSRIIAQLDVTLLELLAALLFRGFV